MADDTDKATEPGTAVATVRRSEVRVHQSGDAVMDTAGFEHMLRIAGVMANSGVMPESLTMEGKGDNKTMLARDIILARAFMIAEQAAMWRRSPFQLMQAASFVHGKLCWEGKVINAVLVDDYGINCTYEFGTWVPTTESVDLSKEGQGDMLGVRVSGMVAGEKQFVDGCVGGWKTTGNNSPWRPGTMKRQLRYRGVREWARAFNPGAVIGIYGDDEQFDEPVDVMPREPRRLVDETDEPRKITGEVIEGEKKPAPAVDKPKATPASATPASDATPGPKASGPAEQPKQSLGGVKATGFTQTRAGHARPGQRYHLEADPMTEDGARATYVDGKEVDPATAKDRFSVFKQHPPLQAGGEVVQLDDHRQDAGQPGSGEAQGASEGEPAQSEPETSEGAPEASETPHDPETGEVIDVEAFNTYATEAAGATTWPDLMKAVNAFMQTNATPDERRQARVVAWERVAALKEAPVHTADPSMFWLWLASAEPHRVTPAFSVLVRSDAYAKLTEDQKDALAQAVEEVTTPA